MIEDYRHSDFFRQWTIKDLLRTDYIIPISESHKKKTFPWGKIPELASPAYSFAHGIRCRKPGGQYPESPDVIFPRYKVALFIYDCVQHGHNCDNSSIPEKIRDIL